MRTILDCFNAGLTRTIGGQVICDRAMLDGWITVHPNGEGTEGVPVLLGPDGTVQGGMGGKFNGQHISQVGGSGESPPQARTMTPTEKLQREANAAYAAKVQLRMKKEREAAAAERADTERRAAIRQAGNQFSENGIVNQEKVTNHLNELREALEYEKRRIKRELQGKSGPEWHGLKSQEKALRGLMQNHAAQLRMGRVSNFQNRADLLIANYKSGAEL